MSLLDLLLGRGDMLQAANTMTVSNPNSLPQNLASPPAQAKPSSSGGALGNMVAPRTAPDPASGGGLGDFLSSLAPAIAMLDPRNQQLGMGLMQMNQNRRKEREHRANQNETVAWMKSLGVDEEEARFLVSNPPALNAWYGELRAGNKPDWKFQEIYDEHGRPQKVMMDMTSGRYNLVGGAKSDTISPDAEQQKIRIAQAGRPETNINLPGQDKFEEQFASADAKMLSDVSTSGLSAQRNIGRINALESLLDGSPSGFSAAATQRAGEWGFKSDNSDTIEAAQALINSLVPEQRPPGSGPMSDADLQLFKQSLPRIINTREGNQLIIDTMRGIAKYDAEGALIVQRLRNREITRSEAFDALQNRKNPLDEFSARIGKARGSNGKTVGGAAQPGVRDYREWFNGD